MNYQPPRMYLIDRASLDPVRARREMDHATRPGIDWALVGVVSALVCIGSLCAYVTGALLQSVQW